MIASTGGFFTGLGIQVFGATGVLAQSLASETPVTFNVPAQPLAHALAAYGAATGLDVFYDADLAEKQRSTEVTGTLTPSAALQILLLGTGYVARTTGPGVFTISRAVRTSVADPGLAREPMIYKSYFAMIQARISDALCQSATIASMPGEVLFRFWLAPSGVVARAEVIADSGELTKDQTLAVAIHGLAIGAPPPGMPQPVNMIILPPSHSSSLCRSPNMLAGKGYGAESRSR